MDEPRVAQLEQDVHLYVAVSTGEEEGVFTVRAFRPLVNNWLAAAG